MALYTSFGHQPNPLGFSLAINDLSVHVTRAGEHVLEYDAERLEEALFTKHRETAFISLTSKRQINRETCSIERAIYCKSPSIIRFLRLISQGHIHLDFTLSQSATGRLKDHGFLWRIHPMALDQLYLSTQVMDL